MIRKFELSKLELAALKTSLYILCSGAFGLFARWMQRMLAFDELNLPTKSAWNIIFPMVVIAAAVLFAHFVKEYKRDRYSLPEDFNGAYAVSSPLIYSLRYVCGGAMCLGAIILLMTCETEKQMVLMRILAVFGVLTGVSYPWLLALAQDPDSNVDLRCWLSVIPVIMFSVWLILTYKMNDINSVEWDFGIEILADCVGIFAFFRVGGFAFNVPDEKRSMFMAMFAPFCFLTCIADSRNIGLQVMYVAAALMMALDNWIFTCNLVQAEPEKVPEVETYNGGFERL